MRNKPKLSSGYFEDMFDPSKMKETGWSRFKKWLNKGFHKDTREDNGLGRFLNGVDNLWNRITGNGLTNAQKEANAFSAKMAEDEFNRQAEFYDENQSIGAQIRQYKENGINPILTASGVGSGSSSPSGGTPSSVSPETADPFSQIAQMFSVVQGFAKTKAEIANINANTAETQERTKGYEGQRQLVSAQVSETLERASNLFADTSIKKEQVKTTLDEALQRIDNMKADTAKKKAEFDAIVDGLKTAALNRDLISKQVQLSDAQWAHYVAQVEKISYEIKILDQDYLFARNTRSDRQNFEKYRAESARIEKELLDFEKELQGLGVPSETEGIDNFMASILARFKLLRESIFDFSFNFRK